MSHCGPEERQYCPAFFEKPLDFGVEGVIQRRQALMVARVYVRLVEQEQLDALVVIGGLL